MRRPAHTLLPAARRATRRPSLTSARPGRARRLGPWLATAALLIVTACGGAIPDEEPGETKQTVTMTGTIQHIDLEGGFFGIVADDGAKYLPINLDEAFQKDGLRVRFEARPEDVMTIYQWGAPVRLLSVAPL